ncbi:MAG: hypothetical protein IPM59_10405 [Chloracidobacterium sp.]|nr:hypothetical protein [Chloracidobacterium sp.]
MREETIQITRERHVADPVRYAESQSADASADFFLSRDSVRLPASFADIFEYPGDDWPQRVAALSAALSGTSCRYDSFERFCLKIGSMSLIELQELYAQSFDLNPNCALEIGYHLFGEDYKRGAFLANLREAESAFELGQERQLPDYLPVLLRLLVYLEDDELRGSLAGYCLIPGLRKVAAALKEHNPFAQLVSALLSTLEEVIANRLPRAAA